MLVRVSATLTSASGGNFENLTLNPAAATTAITDTLNATTVSLTATASVAEGGNITYTASLNNVAQAPVSITLSNGATISIAAGASTGSVSVAAPSDDVYIDAGSVSATIASAAGGNFESLVISPAAATTAITDTLNATQLSLTASASVAEGGSIIYTASLNNVAQTPVSVTLSNGATISIAAGASSGSVSVAAPSDDVYIDAGSVSATIASAAGGNFENLVISPAAATTTITDTLNATTVSLTATASVAEGGSIIYTATLSSAAQSPVSITLSNGATISIAAGASTGSVSVTAPADDVYLDASSISTTIASATGGNFENLAINPAAATTSITDTINATTVSLTATPTVAEGGTITYTASLNNVAQAPVSITLSNGATISIAAGANSGSVSVAAPTDDVYIDAGSVSATITTAAGGNFEALAINPAPAATSITDTLDTTTVSISGNGSVNEGASASYTVSLTSPAQSAVTVNLSYSGTAANGTDFTGVASVTIPAGASSASFSIATIDDALAEGTENFTVSIASATGGNFENLAVSGTSNSIATTIVDNDTPTLSISSPNVLENAGYAQFTVSLSNASTQSTTFNLALSNGSATSGSDFGPALEVSTDGGTTWVAASSVTIAAYQTSVLVRTPVANDTLDETNETFTLTATRSAGTPLANVGGAAIGTATIVDDDTTPVLDLDANNSSLATGANYQTSYVENGTGIRIADSDVSVSDADGSNITSATIRLTNAQVGDVLAVGALPAGITAVINTSVPGQITVTLSGPASTASYQAAIQAVTFSNTSDAPSTIDRNVTVSVTDGTNVSNTGTTTIAVAAVNDPPLANSVAATGSEDPVSPIAITLTGSDVDGTVASFTLSSLPPNGRLYLDAAMTQMAPTGTALAASGNSLTLYFKPLTDWNGTTTFNYTATDNAGASSGSATATLNITPVNDGTPLAANDSFNAVVGTPIIISKAQLLGNDFLPDRADFYSIGTPSSGTLVDNGNGTFTYTPGATGTATFTYSVRDDQGESSTATVSVNVYNTRDDLATVQESALPGGTGGGTRIATGNLLTNDAGNTSIASVAGVTDGAAGDTDTRAGYIGVNTTLGNLVVDITGAGAGDYTYTLNNRADNSLAANANSVTDVIAYTGNSTSANLRVTVQDDRPVASNITIEIPESVAPKFSLVLTIDTSGSMGDQVRSVDANGTVTLTTRLAMQKSALASLLTEYFSQSPDVQVKIVQFSSSATILNGGAAYTSKDAAISAINALTANGSTNYADALVKTQTALGATLDPTRKSAVYFLSDGDPTAGDTANPVSSSGYATYLNTHPELNSYGVGVGTGITNVTHLNQLNNIDAMGDGVRDAAIIVPDLNKLADTLLATVPAAFGGNVVSSNGTQSVTFGADGGYVQSLTLKLDTDANAATPDQAVTFTYNKSTNQISSSGAFPSGFPLSGDVMTLDAAKGFTHGTLVFNFSTGDYSYFTGGAAAQGDSFDLNFVVSDNDGDLASATQTIAIIDGKPVAYADTDTLSSLSTFLEGNVITGLGTDGGLQTGSQLTSFTPQGSGVDKIVDNAHVTSVTFKGVVFDLMATSSGSSAGGTYTIAGGKLTWTHASNGSSLVFDDNGYYKYSPPTADVPNPATSPTNQVTTLTSAANASAAGITLQGMTSTSNTAGSPA